MHASKIKTLLKSINNLKKEVQQAKFEQKDNVRIQKIQRLEQDHVDFEKICNAARAALSDGEFDQIVAKVMNKGPPRVRVASREELKIEINKYKNACLLLQQACKKSGVKVPGFAVSQKKLETPETNLRELDNEKQDADHFEA